MKKQYIEKIDETVLTKTLDNGLEIIFINKPNFSRAIAGVITKIGSVNNKFTLNGKTHKISDGIAHFLEHKMFEKEDGDAFSKYSKYGGSANAYTSFNHTKYYFSSSSNFSDNLDVLLSMMTTPYYTKETVDKEKGIIGEEIKMYEDNTDWMLFFSVLKNLYENHPINVDIGGTQESIDGITAEELYLCYNTFYHPNNSAIIIVGNFDNDLALEKIEQYYGNITTKNEFESIETIDTAVYKKHSELQMDVNNPKCAIGYKQGKVISYDFKRETAINIYLQMLFGKTSDNYEVLAELGIYPEYSYSELDNIGFVYIASDVNDPDVFFKTIDDLMCKELSVEDFMIFKNKNIGELIRNFNTIDMLSKVCTDAFVHGYSIESAIQGVEELTLEDIKKYAKELFNDENMTTTVIKKG